MRVVAPGLWDLAQSALGPSARADLADLAGLGVQAVLVAQANRAVQADPGAQANRAVQADPGAQAGLGVQDPPVRVADKLKANRGIQARSAG